MTIILSSKVILLSLFLECLQNNSVSGDGSTRAWPTKGLIFPKQNARSRFDRIQYREEPVPDHFDAREKWPYCESIGRVINQGNCNFCWAITTAMTLTDRLCIMTKGKDQFEYSAEDPLVCCNLCVTNLTNRCHQAGYAESALYYFQIYGGVSGGDLNSNRGCRPLSKETLQGNAPLCERRCTNPNYRISYDEDKRYIKGSTCKHAGTGSLDVEQLQVEVMKNGPVVIMMYTTLYFMNNYTDEIFMKVDNSDMVNEILHSVRLIGWGNENGTPYWLVANSWGKAWGKMGGFFKILRGENFLRIESSMVAPLPSRNVDKLSVSRVLVLCILIYYFSYYSIF